jgi:hypothetical protein
MFVVPVFTGAVIVSTTVELEFFTVKVNGIVELTTGATVVLQISMPDVTVSAPALATPAKPVRANVPPARTPKRILLSFVCILIPFPFPIALFLRVD